MNPTNIKSEAGGQGNHNWLEVVRQLVESIRFGTVEIVIHDSRVVQIDHTERLRLGGTDGGHKAERPTTASGSSATKATDHPSAKP